MTADFKAHQATVSTRDVKSAAVYFSVLCLLPFALLYVNISFRMQLTCLVSFFQCGFTSLHFASTEASWAMKEQDRGRENQ